MDYSINMNYGHGSTRDPDASGYDTCAKILQDVKRPDGPVGIESGWAFLWNASIRQPSYRDNLYVMYRYTMTVCCRMYCYCAEVIEIEQESRDVLPVQFQ